MITGNPSVPAIRSVKPVREFQDDSPVPGLPPLGIGVFRIHNEKIVYRYKVPLEAHIHIDVVDLVVVMDKGGEEEFFSEVNV
jgi:hypothetical protein